MAPSKYVPGWTPKDFEKSTRLLPSGKIQKNLAFGSAARTRTSLAKSWLRAWPQVSFVYFSQPQFVCRKVCT